METVEGTVLGGGGAYAVLTATSPSLTRGEIVFVWMSGQTESRNKEVEPVGKHLMLWEVDPTKVPADAKERGTAWLVLVEMVKADMKNGTTKDWGSFVGELKGYSIGEDNEVNTMTQTMKYLPYVKFDVRPVATLAQVEEAIKASMK
jgi:muconolactone delta-isomerase